MRAPDDRPLDDDQPPGQAPNFYYVCPKKSLEHNRACGNKNHRTEPLEQRIAEAITDLLCDPARLERQIDQKIERERQAVIAPEKEIVALEERLERLALTRRNYQAQQAAGLMTLDELGQRLSELDEGRESTQRELATVQYRNERIAELGE